MVPPGADVGKRSRPGGRPTTLGTGILSAAPVELALSQRIPYGTTAWRISMGRQVVESANSALKGAFVDLGRGFFRVFGQVKMTVLLGFTVAGFNLDRIRSFRAKRAERVETPRPRTKRRQGTWGDLVGLCCVDGS